MTITIPQEPETNEAAKPQDPEKSAAAPAAPETAAAPQEPAPTANRRELPPDFDEKVLRMLKARADVLQTARYDDMGRVVREPIPDPDAAMIASLNYLAKFVQGDGVADEMHTYLGGGPLPKYWVPSNEVAPALDGPKKRQEQLEMQAMAGRQENPALAALHDYVLDPAGNIVPAFAQVFADTYVGLANWLGAGQKPISVEGVLYGQQKAAERAATAATANVPSKALHFAGKLGGELPAYLAGGGVGAAAKGAGAVAKGNALLRAAKAAVQAPGTVMKAGGAVGAKIGAKVAGAGGVVEAVGRGAGAFGALGAVQKAAEVGRRPTAIETAQGIAIGAAQGAVISASSELAKAAFRGMFRHTYQSLGKTEQEAMDALKKWGEENKVFMRPGDTQTGFVRSLTDKWVDAGMPGAPKMAVKKLLGYAAQGGIESTGFSALDHEFWSQHGEAVLRGDAQALEELGAKLIGGALTLGAFHVPLRDIPAAQRRGSVEPRGETPKPAVAEPAPQEPAAEAPKQLKGGGMEAGVTRMEGEPAPQAVDAGTLRVPQEPAKRDPATGTVLERLPRPLATFGWREVFQYGGRTEVVPGSTEGGGIAPTQAGSRIIELPGTSHSYTVTGDMADANPSLARVLGISEPVPVATMEGLIEHASLLSALAAKSLPGVEIDAGGIKAVGTDGAKDGVQRTIRLGEILEAPLSDGPEPKWKSVAEYVPMRAKDHLEPDQQQVVAVLKDVLTKAVELPEGDRAMLAGVVDVLDTVSARNDKSVAETLAALPKLIETAGSDQSPESASRAIKAAADMLTVKTPEQAMVDMQNAAIAAMTKAADAKRTAPEDVAYDAAREVSRKASREFLQVQKRYRAREIGDAEFLAGKALHDKAMEAFDAAESAFINAKNKPTKLNPESGMVDLGAAVETAARAGKSIGEVTGDTVDAVFRDQIRSLEKLGGDQSLADEMRQVASIARTNMGEAMSKLAEAESLIRENASALNEMVDVRGVQKPRWDALAQGEIEPTNPAEARAADAIKQTLLTLWEIERLSGAFLSKPGPGGEGTTYFERSAGRTEVKIPRVRDDGLADVLASPQLRQRWFAKLAALNPGFSAEAMEKAHIERISGKDISGAEREASFEHIRTLQNVPYEFEGHKILERDPFEAMRRIVAEQSSRAASIRIHGQEGVPEQQQRDVRTRLGLDPEQKGVGPRIDKWFQGLPNQDPAFRERAIDTMTRLQGREPKPLGKRMDKWRRAMGLRRAAMTMLSGLRDIPSMFTEGANWGGVRNMAKAFEAVARNYHEERRRAERLGTLIHEIGNLNVHEATDPLNKAADWLGEFGDVPGIRKLAPRATERFRTVMMTKVADLVLKDWSEGLNRDGSIQLLKELDFKPADAKSLSEGTASEALQNRFRHQMVQRAMSRGRASERSRFSASPFVQSLVDFTGYASKRFYGLAREAKTAVEAFKPGSDATLADKSAIAKRLMTRATGLVAGGMLGDLLYYIVADAIEGKDGWNHYMRDLLTYPWQTVGKASLSGVLSGPLAVLFRAASGSTSEIGESAAQLTVPTGFVASTLRAAHDATTPKGVIESLYDVVASTGIIPQATRLKALAGYVSGAALGENTEFHDDAKLVSQFRRQEGVALPGPSFDKQPEFYVALGQIRDFIDKADMKLSPDDAAKQVRQKADAAIVKALTLQPEENVAAAVRGMQHAENVDKQRLMDYVRDEKRFERIMMHDQMVRELAEAIGKEQGTNPTPFAERLAGAARIAAGKAPNAWSKLARDAVEDAASARLHGQPVGPALTDLANRMSLHPDSVLVDDTLGESDKKLWKRMATQGQRQRFLEGTFRDRVFNAIGQMREADRERR